MTEVTCPTCGESVVIGVPRDGTIEDVHISEGTDPSTDGLRKTRVVRCPESHAIAVTFSVTAPDGA